MLTLKEIHYNARLLLKKNCNRSALLNTLTLTEVTS